MNWGMWNDTEDLCRNGPRALILSLGNEYVQPSRGSQTQFSGELWSFIIYTWLVKSLQASIWLNLFNTQDWGPKLQVPTVITETGPTGPTGNWLPSCGCPGAHQDSSDQNNRRSHLGSWGRWELYQISLWLRKFVRSQHQRQKITSARVLGVRPQWAKQRLNIKTEDSPSAHSS